MELNTFIIIAFATWVFAVTPGPGVLALVSISTSRGFAPCVPFSIGALLGDLIYLTLVILSIEVLSEQITSVLSLVRIIGALYLVYLGYLQWNAGAINFNKKPLSNSYSREIFTGFIISVTNPKVMIFYLSILPVLVDFNKVSTTYNLQIFLAVALGVFSALIIWAILGSSLRSFINNKRVSEVINKIAGTAMIIVGISLFFL
jgi:threonine/homoserine/homoserine lactone efflux protein